MQFIIYSLLIFLATMTGATTGVGGGAIIKPVLDLLGMDDAVTIGVYASIAVFSMCITSLYRQFKKGSSFDIKLLLILSLGSVLGGYLGELIFSQVANHFDNPTVKFLQSLFLSLILIAVLIYTNKKEKLKTLNLSNSLLSFLLAGLVGLISIFLGIGGGPLNIAMLMLLYSYSAKDAAVYSLAMIFFAQLSKMTMILMSIQGYVLNWWLIPAIILFSFLGGLAGTQINRQFTAKQVEKMYMGLMVTLIVICCINILQNI